MGYHALTQRVATCPNCLSDNVLIGSELAPSAEISCSQCGGRIGSWMETRKYVGYEPPSRREYLAGQTKAPQPLGPGPLRR